MVESSGYPDYLNQRLFIDQGIASVALQFRQYIFCDGLESVKNHLITSMFHDVVPELNSDASGFPGHTAGRYKIDPQQLSATLSLLARESQLKTCSVSDFLNGLCTTGLLLTFDDGGVSSIHIADVLDRFGFVGHFFITTNFIGHSSFLNAQQIREIRTRGHVVGSHSCSHRVMAKLNWTEVNEEWKRSAQILSDILGESVNTASVPGGFYSLRVGKAASFQGIRALFTSIPTTRIHYVDRCTIIGRYSLIRDSSPEEALAIANGRLKPRLKQWAFWHAKQILKKLALNQYLRFRKYWLR